MKENNPNFSRREFLKASLLGGAATAAILSTAKAAEILGNERYKVETPEATFYPFFELHNIPITPQELAAVPKTDLLFHEFATASYALSFYPGSQYLHFTGRSFPLSERQIFPRETISYLYDSQAFLSVEGMSPAMGGFEYGVGKYARGAAGILAQKASNLYKQVESPMNYHKQLAKGLDFASLYLLSEALILLPTLSAEAVGARSFDNVSVRRVTQRLSAVTQHITPHDAIIFLRNAMMANKLLFLAENLPRMKRIDGKPSISFVAGAGHSGIEDLLRLRREFSISLLGFYSDKFLQKTVDHNGGLDHFCTVHSVYVPGTVLNIPGSKISLKDEKMLEYLKSRGIT